MNPKISSAVLKTAALICALLSIAAVACIFGFLFAGGWPAIEKIGLFDFLGGLRWQPSNNAFGILPMILTTLLVTGLAVLIGFPLGLLCALFLAFDCPKKLHGFLKGAVMLMAGIPSVVYGFFGLTTIVPFIRNAFGGHGFSVLVASLLLGIMILPTVASVSLTSLQAVAKPVYEGSRALGSSHERSVFFAMIPAARSGILASLVLGLGRAAGETMAVMMVAGNQAVIPESLLEGARTLTANIAMEMGYAAGLQREALIASGAVLLVIVLLFNLILASGLRRKEKS